MEQPHPNFKILKPSGRRELKDAATKQTNKYFSQLRKKQEPIFVLFSYGSKCISFQSLIPSMMMTQFIHRDQLKSHLLFYAPFVVFHHLKFYEKSISPSACRFPSFHFLRFTPKMVVPFVAWTVALDNIEYFTHFQQIYRWGSSKKIVFGFFQKSFKK
jgi:hypothetical protein